MIVLIGILLRLVGLAVIGTAVWYTPYRLSRLLGLKRAWPLCTVVAAVIFLTMIGMLSLSKSSGAVAGGLTTAAGLVFALFTYFFLVLAVLDLVRVMIRLPDLATAGLALGLALVITVFGAWRATPFAVTEVEIPIPGLEQAVTLMHISDLHIGPHRGRAFLEKIVAVTNRRQPDLVLLNGDLLDSNLALKPGVLSALSRLQAPVYATTGNHDHYVDTERALKLFAELGVRFLHNEAIETHGFQLVGLDYMNADEKSFDMHAVNKLTIKKELPEIPLDRNKPVILMHHSPVGLKYVAQAGVDLMLSGHTHAGQMFPATLMTPYIFPLNKGLHHRGDTTFFVSQGAGTYGPRIRLGSQNEINLIRLTPKI